MSFSLNHQVAGKSEVLKCMDCHGAKGLLEWKALGYEGDPMKKK